MKITIEPTEPKNVGFCTVSVSRSHDDLSVDELLQMVRAALLAAGFHPDTVKEAIGED